jgi:haloacetate dehalogenase
VLDCIDLMRHLGFKRFAVAGHDRGSYVALRAALDHPEIISRLAVLDSIPILEHLLRCNEVFARRWYHCFFFAQPEKPERAILTDPLAWYGGSPQSMGQEEFEDFRLAVTDPATVHGMVEDYRAGLTIDRQHDEAD